MATDERFGDRVAYAISQPTLLAYWPELEEILASLGPVYACAWAALELSDSIFAPIASDPRVPHNLLVRLQALGVVQSAHRTGLPRRATYDKIGWGYSDPWAGRPDLAASIIRTMTASPGRLTMDEQISLWKELARQEIEAYLSTQMRRIGVDPGPARRLASAVEADWDLLSVGRRRYVIWSASRSDAVRECGLQPDGAPPEVQIVNELRRRSVWLRGRELRGEIDPAECCFVPDKSWRRPILLDVAVERVLQLGQDYWLYPPDSLRGGLAGVPIIHRSATSHGPT